MERGPKGNLSIPIETWIKLILILVVLLVCVVDWDGDGLPGIHILRFLLTH